MMITQVQLNNPNIVDFTLCGWINIYDCIKSEVFLFYIGIPPSVTKRTCWIRIFKMNI